MSLKSRIAEEKEKEAQQKPEWDRSTVASDTKKNLSVEDKMASKIAKEILKDNQKLKGVHSNQSMQKMLEREAKRQLLIETGGQYNAPVMSKINERGEMK